MDERFREPYSDPRWWYAGDYTPICFECAHFQGMIQGKVRCSAFPDGIPRELTGEGVIHDKPFPGDRGIRFEPYQHRMAGEQNG